MKDDDKDQQPEAGILRKPIHDQATRKVSALPTLIKKSERPDGAKAAVIDAAEPDAPSDPMAIEVDDGGLFDDLD